ncbi:hypothetical protein [Actinomadura rupiterrae]|uniref:hypothetical protein n=1 Tax=Actinomadura rupiterrae TaxID=559627 RepID=UPI0020A29342|nr:hypothetical protein [Actinomadura rupiterrae]MCP2338573.1 hypothetical protein [Actinomadura rupiterrae]
MRRLAAAAVAALLPALLAGCGVRATEVVGAGDGPRPTGQPNEVPIYLVKDGKLVRTGRSGLLNEPYLGLQQLTIPPLSTESSQGLVTTVPRSVGLSAAFLDGAGVLTVHIDQADVNWPRVTIGQVVCTANAAPNVKEVRLDYPVTITSRKSSEPTPPATRPLAQQLKQAAARYNCGQFADLMAR